MQHHSGFEPVTLKGEKLTFSSSSLYQQSYHATCNLKISIGGFFINHLVWNFVFTQYLGPSAFRKTKALGSSFKQWEYRGPSFYCSYCSHRTVPLHQKRANSIFLGFSVWVICHETTPRRFRRTKLKSGRLIYSFRKLLNKLLKRNFSYLLYWPIDRSWRHFY